jgi:predicted enzyme related to lactoylglutathione lyase
LWLRTFKKTPMSENKQPTMGNGKICYLEMPAVDVNASAEFYKHIFGWNLRTRGDGSVSFDDGVGEVSGTWVLNRKPMTEVGLLVYIMVDSVAGTINKVTANGGTIVQPIGGDAPEITARFKDPAGNILGLYQHRD